MTNDRIGEAAGEVWSVLVEKEGCTLSQLKRQVSGCTGDEVVAAIGWLAREGKLSFEAQGRKTIVALCEAAAGVV